MDHNPPEPVHYDGSAGGWGSLRGIGKVFGKALSRPGVLDTLMRQNKPGGLMCGSCAWGKPATPHLFEFCENGAKSTIWEMTRDRCTPAFFTDHTVSQLREWQDYDLEMQGRLTEPLRYDPVSDRYVQCGWDEAFAGIGTALKGYDPKSVVFYASGKASLETSYLYSLFARFYGCNNLPDSSNMCHETTSVGLKQVIGSPVGTCTLEDFAHCDSIFFFGQNPGSNSPRFLHPLQDAVKNRDCKIVTFNPVRERGLEQVINPQNPMEMLTGHGTTMSCLYLQVRPGGDTAALMGMCKHVLARDAERGGILDRDFIDQHTSGFDAFAAMANAADWTDIEHVSGLPRHELQQAADIYIAAKTVIGVYGMGLTQHVHGSQSIGMLVNFLMLRGNLGKQGAGICPVRGHSNVQGQRTVGITEKPSLVPMDRLAKQFGFDPPTEEGLTTVRACEGIRDGSVRALISLGGNLVRAVPERAAMEQAWQTLDLTVFVATKLNRGHLVHGRASYLLPCLGRTERDVHGGVNQIVTIEDSFSHIHGSVGKRPPAAANLKSELAIVAGMAKASLAPHPQWQWDAWTDDYGLVRTLIEQTYPDQFQDFNKRLFQPGGFYRGNAAHERIWKTESRKAGFTCPTRLSALAMDDAPGRFTLITMRSNDQFNTTIYGFEDRLRGLSGSRMILLISPADMEREHLAAGDTVSLVSDAGDGVDREVSGLTVTPFSLPDGCVGGYYPEMNGLVPLWLHDQASKTPASKGVPVRIRR